MPRTTDGWGHGLLGVIIFSGSLPATRIAVGGFTPLFLTSARAVIAALLGAALLRVLRQTRPAVGDLGSLAIVALGVVVGFPLLTALALQHITSARSIVFIGFCRSRRRSSACGVAARDRGRPFGCSPSREACWSLVSHYRRVTTPHLLATF